MKYIMIPSGTNKRLQKAFNVSEVTVTSALHFRTNSELANKIRRLALSKEYGGAVRNK